VTPTMIRIGAINHLEGGIDTRPDRVRSLDRLDAQLDLLAELDLDVVLSTEGKGWLDDDNQLLGYAAHRLGMNPFVAPAPRHDCNVVIWLRPGRFRDVREHHIVREPFWHGQARVEVSLDGLRERLWLVAAHFSPFVPAIRTAEAYATLELAADGRLVIGGGDFQDDANAEEAPDRSHMDPARRLRYGTPGDPQSPAELFRGAGMVDVAAALDNRQPTAGFVDRAPLRCDRFHLSSRLAHTPRAYRAHPDPDGKLSDHLIIDAELDLTAAI
jgi:endonuclease/exonuclease/phosphatase family metal-dependent hydrolase